MRIEIEMYRGWQIYFDTDRNYFYAISDAYDLQKDKPSFPSIKKYIDDYVKSNMNFEPFMVEKKPNRHSLLPVQLKIIGMRMDGHLMTEDGQGRKSQLSDSYTEDYFRINPANTETVWQELWEIKQAQDRLNEKADKIVEGYAPGESMADFVKKFNL